MCESCRLSVAVAPPLRFVSIFVLLWQGNQAEGLKKQAKHHLLQCTVETVDSERLTSPLPLRLPSFQACGGRRDPCLVLVTTGSNIAANSVHATHLSRLRTLVCRLYAAAIAITVHDIHFLTPYGQLPPPASLCISAAGYPSASTHRDPSSATTPLADLTVIRSGPLIRRPIVNRSAQTVFPRQSQVSSVLTPLGIFLVARSAKYIPCAS